MSDIIQLLPDHIANQIAAGEVVQRPASVVKELLENALDAGASKIQLIVKEGGKALIQVIDNGCGMSVTDARMCFERHATSKIKKAEDLFSIRTMGFRGEAMASIAAIAHIDLKTRRVEDEIGTQILIEGSLVIEQNPLATPLGTSIAVKNLFYNVPARRNFLKDASYELRQIINELQRVALANPSISFSMHHDGKELYHLNTGNLKQRIVHLLGNSYNDKLVPIEESTDFITVKGFIGKPEYAKKSKGEQFFFVNNRFIRDAYLNHAVTKAFDGILPKDTYPTYIIFIDIHPKHIDINVHPTKTEIKFDNEKTIYAILVATIRKSIGKYHIIPSIDFDQEPSFNQIINSTPSDNLTSPYISVNTNYNPFNQKKESLQKSNYSPQKGIPSQWETLYQISENQQPQQTEISTFVQDTPNESIPTKKLIQLHKKYILAPTQSGIMLINQHLAHEKILYTHYTKLFDTQSATTQKSLFPQTITFDQHNHSIVEEILPELNVIGFDIRHLGNNTFVVDGIPTDLSGQNEIQILEQLIEDYKNNYGDIKLDAREKLIKSLAKTTAIKPNTELSIIEMENLIDELFSCEIPNLSTKGENIIVMLNLNDLDNLFKTSN